MLTWQGDGRRLSVWGKGAEGLSKSMKGKEKEGWSCQRVHLDDLCQRAGVFILQAISIYNYIKSCHTLLIIANLIFGYMTHHHFAHCRLSIVIGTIININQRILIHAAAGVDNSPAFIIHHTSLGLPRSHRFIPAYPITTSQPVHSTSPSSPTIHTQHADHRLQQPVQIRR